MLSHVKQKMVRFSKLVFVKRGLEKAYSSAMREITLSANNRKSYSIEDATVERFFREFFSRTLTFGFICWVFYSPSLSSNRLRKNAKKIFSKVPGACPYQHALYTYAKNHLRPSTGASLKLADR